MMDDGYDVSAVDNSGIMGKYQLRVAAHLKLKPCHYFPSGYDQRRLAKEQFWVHLLCLRRL